MTQRSPLPAQSHLDAALESAIAAALYTAPVLDPARRAALGAMLERLAREPGGDDAPPGAAGAPDAPPAPHKNGIRPAGAPAIVGVLALLALGGALWRMRGAAGGPDQANPSTALPAAANASGAAPNGGASSPADAPRTLSASDPTQAVGVSNGADAAHRADVAATQTASRVGLPSVGNTAAGAAVAAAATTTAAARQRSLRANAATLAAGLPGGAAFFVDSTSTATADTLPAPTKKSKDRAIATAVPERTPTSESAPGGETPTPGLVHPCAALAQPNVLAARIVADDGAPIADAVVTLFLVGQLDFASFGASDANGCVAIEQAPGRYELRAQAAGHDARWYPDAVDRAGAVGLDVDGAAARPPVDIRLPRASATAVPPPSDTAAPPPPSATPTAALPPAIDSPTAAARATAEVAASDATRPLDASRIDNLPDIAAPNIASDIAAPDVAAALAALPADRQRQLDGLAEFAQDGGTVTAVALDAHVVWGVVGPRVVAWPRGSDGGGAAAPVAWTPVLPEVPEAIAIDNGRLVVATPGQDGAPATVWIFDVAAAGTGGPSGLVNGRRSPGAVDALGACDLALSGASTVTAMAADDTWIYVLTERGLSVVDAKRAAAPVELGFSAAGTAPSARAAGSLALIGDGAHVLIARPSGLQVIDVRAPTSPRVVFQGVPRDVHAVAAGRGEGGAAGADGATGTAGQVAVAVEAVTGRLAGSGGMLRLTTLDVSDPTRPRALAAVALPEGVAAAGDGARAVTAMAGAQAAVVDGDGRSLWLVDLAQPDAPVVSRRLTLSSAPTGAAALAMDADGAAAVALGASGIRLLVDGIETPGNIVPPIAQLAIAPGGAFGWGAAGAVGIVAIDLNAQRSAAAPGHVYLAVAEAAASDGSAAEVHSVLAVGDAVYALTRRGGLIAFDGSDPRRPRRLAMADGRLAAIDGGAETVQMALDGGRLYVPDAAGAVHVIDVRRPDEPRLTARLDAVGSRDDRLVALAADGETLYALTSDGHTSRLHALDVRETAAPRRVETALYLGRTYRHVALAAGRLVLSGDRRSPGLGAVDRGLDPSTLLEVPGLAAGVVGLIDLPGGVRRALVADDAFLTAVDLDALGDDARRISGRSVRLPLGRRAAGGASDVRIVGDQVFVARHEAGLFARPHGGIFLPAAPAAATPGTADPGRLTYRLYLPAVVKNHPPCPQPSRVQGVLLVDAAAEGDHGLARLRPAVAAWLGGLGVGPRPGTGASIVLWGEQANFVAQGDDPALLSTSFPRNIPRPGRRVDLALKGAEQQLGVRAGAASSEIVGRIVIVAADGWPESIHANAVADAARLRAAGWRLEAVALGERAPVAQLADLTGDASGVARVATLAELPAALAAAGRAAWLCPR